MPPGDSFDLDDLAQQAGINVAPVGISSSQSLDELAADPSQQQGGLSGAIPTDTFETVETPDGAGKIIGAGNGSAPEALTRPEHANGIHAQEILDALESGDLDRALDELTKIQDGRIIDILIANMSSGITKYVDKLSESSTDDIVHSVSFEVARTKASSINGEIGTKITEAVDIGEASAILASKCDKIMKVILATRLTTKDRRASCIASVCVEGLNDKDQRTEEQINEIATIMSSFGVDSEEIKNIKGYLSRLDYSGFGSSVPNYSVATVVDFINDALNAATNI